MSSENRFSDYDTMNGIYFSESKETYENYLATLEGLILKYFPKGSHIFDLCCGRGELTQQLLEKGYQVTGLDGSEVELRYARENVPSVEFILDDARYFKLPPTFQAVVSIGTSLNYIMSVEELESVFHNVYVALLENGLFAFELSLEEEYLPRFSVPTNRGDVEDNLAWIERRTYNKEKKVVQENYTKFQLIKGEWQRSDMSLQRKAYSQAEVQSALEKVGFTEIRIYDEERDLGVSGKAGRGCFVCRKP